MGQYLKSKGRKRYTILAPGRMNRPEQTGEMKPIVKTCPFCVENLDETKILDRIDDNSNTAWSVVCVSNKYPITALHEVIIHNPKHDMTIEKMSDSQLFDLMKMYQSRYEYHKDMGRVVMFCNFGSFAGASIAHPHSQVMVVDRSIDYDEIDFQDNNDVVVTSGDFSVYAPKYSEFAYELWIGNPTKSIRQFDEDDLRTAGRLLGFSLNKLITHLSEKNPLERHEEIPHLGWKEYGVNYNYYFGGEAEGKFFIRIIPKLAIQAGFELATGINVNVVDSDEVNNMLREDL